MPPRNKKKEVTIESFKKRVTSYVSNEKRNEREFDAVKVDFDQLFRINEDGGMGDDIDEEDMFLRSLAVLLSDLLSHAFVPDPISGIAMSVRSASHLRRVLKCLDEFSLKEPKLTSFMTEDKHLIKSLLNIPHLLGMNAQLVTKEDHDQATWLLDGLMSFKEGLKTLLTVLTSSEAMLNSLGNIASSIAYEYSYCRQDDKLLFITKVYAYVKKKGAEQLANALLDKVHPSIKSILLDPHHTPSEIYHDSSIRREILNNVNRSNPNLHSLKVAEAQFITTWTPMQLSRKLSISRYVDMGKHEISFAVGMDENEIWITLPYDTITELTVVSSTNSAHLFCNEVPTNLNQLVSDLPTNKKFDVLFKFIFENDGDVEEFENTASSRIEDRKIALGQKVSVASNFVKSPQQLTNNKMECEEESRYEEEETYISSPEPTQDDNVVQFDKGRRRSSERVGKKEREKEEMKDMMKQKENGAYKGDEEAKIDGIVLDDEEKQRIREEKAILEKQRKVRERDKLRFGHEKDFEREIDKLDEVASRASSTKSTVAFHKSTSNGETHYGKKRTPSEASGFFAAQDKTVDLEDPYMQDFERTKKSVPNAPSSKKSGQGRLDATKKKKQTAPPEAPVTTRSSDRNAKKHTVDSYTGHKTSIEEDVKFRHSTIEEDVHRWTEEKTKKKTTKTLNKKSVSREKQSEPEPDPDLEPAHEEQHTKGEMIMEGEDSQELSGTAEESILELSPKKRVVSSVHTSREEEKEGKDIEEDESETSPFLDEEKYLGHSSKRARREELQPLSRRGDYDLDTVSGGGGEDDDPSEAILMMMLTEMFSKRRARHEKKKINQTRQTVQLALDQVTDYLSAWIDGVDGSCGSLGMTERIKDEIDKLKSNSSDTISALNNFDSHMSEIRDKQNKLNRDLLSFQSYVSNYRSDVKTEEEKFTRDLSMAKQNAEKYVERNVSFSVKDSPSKREKTDSQLLRLLGE